MKLRIAAVTLAALLPIACGSGDRSYEIDEVRTGRPPEIPRGATVSDHERLGFASTHQRNPRASNPHGSAMPTFAWDLPEGWKELPRKQFRDANFTLERDPSVECYMTIMPGSGGGLEGNVNRWRGQMQLPPLEAGEIAKLPKTKFFKRDVPFVELTGTYVGRGGAAKEDYAFLAVFLEAPGTTITLKMTGPAAVVMQEKDRFLELVASMRLDSSHGRAPSNPPPRGNDAIAAGMASGASGFAWDVPEGWEKGRDRSMRIVTFHPAGNTDAQCYVSMMGGTAGGIDMNVNRWLGEIGKPPMKPVEIAKLPRIDMLGRKAVLIEASGDEHKGMDGKTVEGAGLLGLVCLLDDRALFVKMIGPAKLVATEKENFLAFSRSLRTGE